MEVFPNYVSIHKARRGSAPPLQGAATTAAAATLCSRRAVVPCSRAAAALRCDGMGAALLACTCASAADWALMRLRAPA